MSESQKHVKVAWVGVRTLGIHIDYWIIDIPDMTYSEYH